MKDGVFVDSGAFIAFLDRSDSLHEEVSALFAKPPRSLLTSVFVIAETQGWLLNRLGEDAARSILRLVAELPHLKILGADEGHHREVVAKLEAHRGAKLTYADASGLVWLRKLRLTEVWGSDYHLAIEGAHVVPGPPPR